MDTRRGRSREAGDREGGDAGRRARRGDGVSLGGADAREGGGALALASRDLAEGFATTRLSRYALPSFDIVDQVPHDPSLGIEADDLWALRQLRRRPNDRRKLEAALANLSARDPRGMALDEIRMAALALRRAREHRELTARLQIINRAGGGERSRRGSAVEMAEMV